MSESTKAAELAMANFLAGGFAGFISTVATNPLDVLRARLAASRDATAMDKRLWLHLRTMGWKGMWAGLLVNLGASMPSNSIYLPMYRFLKEDVLPGFGIRDQYLWILSAAGAVTTTNLVLGPAFMVRTRIQLDSSHGIWYYIKDIFFKQGGFYGFYRGTGVNVAGRIFEECTFWTIYEYLKRVTNENQGIGNGRFWWSSCAVVSLSGASKLIGSTLSYPYNVVMTHIREVNKKTQRHEHTKVVPTIKFIYRNDGWKGFYKGITPHIMRSVISKASQIWAWEFALSQYMQYCDSRRTRCS